MRAAELDQAVYEREQLVVDLRPVEPRDLVVLAVGVVVAVLRPPNLIAATDHRYPDGEDQGRQKVPLLTRPQAVDRIILCRPFLAAVPRPVVVGSVGIVLAVGLVVLVVVRNEIA